MLEGDGGDDGDDGDDWGESDSSEETNEESSEDSSDGEDKVRAVFIISAHGTCTMRFSTHRFFTSALYSFTRNHLPEKKL